MKSLFFLLCLLVLCVAVLAYDDDGAGLERNLRRRGGRGRDRGGRGRDRSGWGRDRRGRGQNQTQDEMNQDTSSTPSTPSTSSSSDLDSMSEPSSSSSFSDSTSSSSDATSSSSDATSSSSDSSSTSSSSSSSSSGSASFISECVDTHNIYRDEVGVPRITWSEKLAAQAQAWADTLAAKGYLEHSTVDPEDISVGENIATCTTWPDSHIGLIKGWASEKVNFIPGNNYPDVAIDGKVVDHYTQIVWRKTTKVGCGIASGSDGWDYLVCNYESCGNIFGEPVY